MRLPTESRTIARFSRKEFLRERWHYKPGEHVTFIGPTGSGKTMLAYELLKETTKPELPGIVMVVKPRDATVAKWTKVLGYKKTKNWPPPPTLIGKKPSGYVVWPDHTFEPEVDDKNHYTVFRKVILNSYKRGYRIIFADELYGLVKELRLERPLVTVWSRGRSMGTGLWGATQKPTHVPLWAYNQAEHLFLSNDPDKRSRDRFGEIGGVDPYLIQQIVMSLGKYEWLYIGREGPVMCIIEKE